MRRKGTTGRDSSRRTQNWRTGRAVNNRYVESRMPKAGGRTLCSGKTWSTGYRHRLRRQSRSRELQFRPFGGISSRLAHSLRALRTKAKTHTSRVAFPNHRFTSMMAESLGLTFSMILLHLSAIWLRPRQPSGFKVESGYQKSLRTLVATSTKYGTRALVSTRPNAGAIALL